MSTDQCPYCLAEVEINHDDGYGYEEGELHHQECGSCDKTFVYQTCISIDHDTYKADCLNGGEHNYEKTKTIPEKYAKLRCTECWDDRPLL